MRPHGDVLRVLASLASPDGLLRLSEHAIARACGISRGSWQRTRASLVRAGALEIVSQGSLTGAGGTMTLRVTCSASCSGEQGKEQGTEQGVSKEPSRASTYQTTSVVVDVEDLKSTTTTTNNNRASEDRAGALARPLAHRAGQGKEQGRASEQGTEQGLLAALAIVDRLVAINDRLVAENAALAAALDEARQGVSLPASAPSPATLVADPSAAPLPVVERDAKPEEETPEQAAEIEQALDELQAQNDEAAAKGRGRRVDKPSGWRRKVRASLVPGSPQVADLAQKWRSRQEARDRVRKAREESEAQVARTWAALESEVAARRQAREVARASGT